jgi:hypothetical protein
MALRPSTLTRAASLAQTASKSALWAFANTLLGGQGRTRQQRPVELGGCRATYQPAAAPFVGSYYRGYDVNTYSPMRRPISSATSALFLKCMPPQMRALSTSSESWWKLV